MDKGSQRNDGESTRKADGKNSPRLEMLSYADWNGLNVEEEGHRNTMEDHHRGQAGTLKNFGATDLVITFQESASGNVEIKDVMYSTETARHSKVLIPAKLAPPAM